MSKTRTSDWQAYQDIKILKRSKFVCPSTVIGPIVPRFSEQNQIYMASRDDKSPRERAEGECVMEAHGCEFHISCARFES